MSKAVLVIDMPEKCKICKFHYPARDMHTGAFMGGCRLIQTMAINDSNSKPDWCPMKPIPEKFGFNSLINGTYEEGWNACIDEICKSDNIPYWQNEIFPTKSITAAKINVSNFECRPVFKSDNDPTDE